MAGIWIFERAPPQLGEVEELIEAQEELTEAPDKARQRRVGIELALVVAGVAAMAIGASALVEAVRQITSVEDTQTKLGLTVVGFATAFELVVLVWSTTRRGSTDVALAGVVGSFGYNVTMSLGAGAVIRPIEISDAASLHLSAVVMVGLLVLVMALAAPKMQLGRLVGVTLLCGYPLFVLAVVL